MGVTFQECQCANLKWMADKYGYRTCPGTTSAMEFTTFKLEREENRYQKRYMSNKRQSFRRRPQEHFFEIYKQMSGLCIVLFRQH